MLPLLTMLALAAPPADGARRWDATGHRVVGEIAWAHLTPAARAAAAALLRATPPDAGIVAAIPADAPPEAQDRELFVASTVWADLLRPPAPQAATYHHPTWHYDEVFWRRTNLGVGRVDLPAEDPEEASERIITYLGDLAAGEGTAAERGVKLAWILHLTGDIHQPLHSGSRVTDQDPRGDRGGNAFSLGERRNLHSYWDGALSRATPGDPRDGARSRRIADSVVARVPMRTASLGAPGAGAAWAEESRATLQSWVYNTERNVWPDATYEARVRTTAEERVALAGYRLAQALNAAFDAAMGRK